jgi:Nif-specific regulatory protein
MPARLIAVSGPLKGRAFPLAVAETLVGREDDSVAIDIAHTSVSRKHCLIEAHGDRLTLRDLGSRNGTLLNGERVQVAELKIGDRISVGIAVFRLVSEEEGESDVEITDHPIDEESVVAIEANASSASQHLVRLLRFTTNIGWIRDPESLQWQLLGQLFEILPAERGATVLVDEQGQTTQTIAWNYLEGPTASVRISRTVVDLVLRTKRTICVNDVRHDPQFSGVDNVAAAETCSLLAAPLLIGSRVLGLIYLDAVTPGVKFERSHLELLSGMASIAALGLANAQHLTQLEGENRLLRSAATHGLIGRSPEITKIRKIIDKAAPTNATVMVLGESGTGKEVVARALHAASPRSAHPFVAVNCAALPETLMQTELFGHEKGAFTGAAASKQGLFEVADHGTIFLDEIGDLPLQLQTKLLRALQEQEIMRVGATRPRKVDVRVVAATNQDLEALVHSGAFRKDLFHRLNVVSLNLPALRERREDIPLLANHFVSRASTTLRRAHTFSPRAMELLVRYDWPGNVRELQNVIERAIVLGSGETILPEDLPDNILDRSHSATVSRYHASLIEAKRDLIISAFRKCNGNYTEAAHLLGLHPNYLHRLIKNLQLKADLLVRVAEAKDVAS